SGLRGLVAVIDGKTVVCGTDPSGTELAAGQVVIVRGHADFAASCRQQFAARRGPARAVGGMAAPAPPSPAPAASPTPPPADPTHADAVLAAVARGIVAGSDATSDDDEEEKSTPSPGPTVTKATAEMFARLRREVAASEEDDSDEKAA